MKKVSAFLFLTSSPPIFFSFYLGLPFFTFTIKVLQPVKLPDMLPIPRLSQSHIGKYMSESLITHGVTQVMISFRYNQMSWFS